LVVTIISKSDLSWR